MNSEDQVSLALRTLAEADRKREASQAVEDRVLREFRRGRSKRNRPLAWLTVAAALAVGAFLWRPAPEVPPRPQVTRVEAPPPEPVRVVPKRAAPRPPEVVHEVATEFFPVVETAPDFEHGALVRVRVPSVTMRNFGLPVREERWAEPVDADLLVGQEGMVRAIRFVSVQPRP